jgi:hypothetical protein
MSPFYSAGPSVQSTTGSRGVRISGSNAGYTMFRGSVKSTGYPLHSPVSPSLPLPCVTVCHHISTGLYVRRLFQRSSVPLAVCNTSNPCMPLFIANGKGKDKAKGTVHPITGHEGPEGEYRYNYTLSLTSTLDGVGDQRQASASLSPGKRTGTHCIGGCVDMRFCPDGRGNFAPHRDSIPRSSHP